LAAFYTAADRKAIESASTNGLAYIANATEATRADFEMKQREIESRFNPIMARVYQASGASMK
jgi:hypothetical protein